MLVCWCGNTDFLPFGSEYGECRTCGTLVYFKEMPPEQLLVRDDEIDFYGKKYWLEHQQDAFGYTDIYNRARNDLTERNLHWLKALLKYRLPPAKVLEVGCAHGSFVALMQQAGYEASGVELSPWVVSYGQETFGVPIHIGPVESLDLPLASLDVIALMDVLEHLPDPMATMRCCLELLKPDGLLLIQTPQFKEGMCYEALVESKNVFLDQLKSDEHLYLFSERSVTDFFGRLGAKHIYFEPAIFAHYDMFFAVSWAPLKTHTLDEIESALLATPNGRFALALLDISAREQRGEGHDGVLIHERNLVQAQLADLQRNFDATEQDRLARGDVINAQGQALSGLQAEMDARLKELAALYERAETLQNERNLVQAQLADLQRNFDATEQDRLARGDVINAQGQALSGLQAEMDARLKELAALYERAETLQNERNLVQAQLADLQRNFDATEQDRLARGDVINAQGQALSGLQAEMDARLKELAALYERAETLQNERNLVQAQLADLQRNFDATEQDRLARGDVINAQGQALSGLQAEMDARLKELAALYERAETLQNERNLVQAQLADLQRNFDATEQDRLARGDVINAQGQALSGLQAEMDARLKELAALYERAETLQNERNLVQAQLADLQRNFDATEQDRLARGEVIEEQGSRVVELERAVWLTEQNRDWWKDEAARLRN